MGSSGGFLEIGHEGGDPRLKGAPVVTGAWDDEGDGGGGGCDGGDGDGSAPGCSASVGGGSGVSVAPSQLRVFGKATGLSRVGFVARKGTVFHPPFLGSVESERGQYQRVLFLFFYILHTPHVMLGTQRLRVFFSEDTGRPGQSGRVGAWVRVSGNVSRRLGLYGRMRAIAEQNPIRIIRLTFSEEVGKHVSVFGVWLAGLSRVRGWI